MSTFHVHQNLLVQADSVFRHCRQGSIKTRKCSREAACRLCWFLAEVYRLECLEDLALKTGLLTVKGKGGKVRTVPVADTVRMELEKLLRQTARGHKLFVSDSTPTDRAINQFQCFLYRHCKEVQDAASTRPMTCHGLRHSYAVEQYLAFLTQGLDENDACRCVSKLLGHERPDVTRIYLASIRKGGGGNRK